MSPPTLRPQDFRFQSSFSGRDSFILHRMHPLVTAHPFGVAPDTGRATLYTLRQTNGVTLTVTDYGATWVGWNVPDRRGAFADIVLGFESAAEYAKHTGYFGATCGRIANRIEAGRFRLDGREYRTAINNGPNTNHGGLVGFDRHAWTATVGGAPDAPSVTFSRRSPDGEEGFPGNLDVAVTYTLEPEGDVRIDYRASTDAPTILNLTNHAYFHLGGHASGTVDGHTLRMHADLWLPSDDTAVPTGEMLRVDGTPFDFRTSRAIGEHLHSPHPQIAGDRGYDKSFVIRGASGELRKAAELSHEETGRTLVVETTEPDVHLYTGNWIAECVGDIPGKGGAKYGKHSGLCLEAQKFANAINRPGFPSVILRPGEIFATTTVHRLRVR